MIYTEKPAIFLPLFEVSGCFIECNDEILLLHRQDYKPQGNTWCLPAGKVNKNEDKLEAIIREVKEETGLSFAKNGIRFSMSYFVRYVEYDFIYHNYFTTLKEKPEIKINPQEHKNFAWATPEKALLFNLIQDEGECIKKFYHI